MKKANYTYTLDQSLKRTENDIARFWEKVDRRQPGECWLWHGTHLRPNSAGLVYGGFVVTLPTSKTYTYRAHRFAWMLANGRLPQGMVVMHTCDTPLCVNPGHLELGTQADNLHDRDRKGRQLRGETHNMVKLTEEQVREIWFADRSLTHGQIAKQYGVTPHAIGAIWRGRSWRHVTSQWQSPSKGTNL